MFEIEIPQQYAEALLQQCSETNLSLEELVEAAIVRYMEDSEQ